MLRASGDTPRVNEAARSTMEAVVEFLAMGGHAAYIWPAFGLTAVVMIGLLVASLRALKRERATLVSLEAARPAGRRVADDRPAS